MAKKKTMASNKEATPIFEQGNVLVFQCKRPVTDFEFELIKKRLESQQSDGVKIILVPYSVKLKED